MENSYEYVSELGSAIMTLLKFVLIILTARLILYLVGFHGKLPVIDDIINQILLFFSKGTGSVIREIKMMMHI